MKNEGYSAGRPGKKAHEIPIYIPVTDLEIWDTGLLTVYKTVLKERPPYLKSKFYLHADFVTGPLTVCKAYHFKQVENAIGNVIVMNDALKKQGLPEKYWRTWPVLCMDHRPVWIFGGQIMSFWKPPVPGEEAIAFEMRWQCGNPKQRKTCRRPLK